MGGISVKEHFEINLVPLTIGMTKKFYSTMMKFCFPERESENIDYSDRVSEDGTSEPKTKKVKAPKRNRDSNFYVLIDDVEKMKVKASPAASGSIFINCRNEPRKISCSSTSKYQKCPSKSVTKGTKRRTSKIYGTCRSSFRLWSITI